uniref:Calcium voltage-gated channel subunit alpha1 I n=1 Tax=Sparus aurata TaxID=8175 RepID=A0A671VPW0_SPAAU
MTSEEEEGPSVATPTATAPSAAAFSGVTAAIARGDGNDAVTSSSPRRPSPLRLPRPEEKEEKEEEIVVEGIIQEERIEKEEEECEADDEDGDDDGSSDTSVLVVPYPELVPVVFFCLKQTTCPRSWCIRMDSRFVFRPPTWFERVSIMVILLNCMTLGMYQPCENIDCSSDRCQILQAFDAFIYIFFALEMVIKMVALGIFGRRCYLGDTWNRLDFFIVMAGMVEYSLDLQNMNFTAIRTVRVLRPLKAINRVPSMRILVNLLLDTLPMLGNVLLLCFFVFFIFGIIGVQLWAGLLRNRCYPEENFTLATGISLPRPYYMPDEDDERPFICSLPVDNGIMSCTDVPARREGGRACCLDKDDALYRQSLGLSPEPLTNGTVSVAGLCVNWNRYYTRCHTGHKNPHKGAINFDNIAYAWIVIFQVITLEGWVEIMYYVMDAHSFYNFIYFILLIIVGSFFMINLCLVVIATQFSETKQREHQLMQEQRAQCSSSSTLASEPGDCYEELFQLVCHVLRKARRQTIAFFNTLRGKPRGFRGVGRGRGGGEGRERKANGREGAPCPHHNRPDHASPMALTAASATHGCPQCAAALSLNDGVGPVRSANDEAEEGAVEETDREGVHSGNQENGKKGQNGAGRHGGCSPKISCRELWHNTRMKLWGIVESKYFNRGIMIAILINTISMGIEHHEQPEELTNVLEICNIVFTSMFSLEMILKITAFGSFSYLRNPYNVFDGVIVIISVCEIVGQSDGGLSVLRTFRLLRVLKLVRFMPALRRQLVVLMKTMDNVATFCMLLMLFIFIFSILGMHIFGCKFSLKTETGDTVPDRKNFDSLLWAIVTVFQILTQEDWNVVLYNGMAATSPIAALYFVALMTFGNYVLFNLLVAILVEGFQAEVRTHMPHGFRLQDASLICTLTPNGHLELGALSGSRRSYSSERRSFTIESRKSSVMSLGKSSLERRSYSLICPRNSHFSSLLQSLCFRIQKMMEVYKPDWCETREEWSVYLFSPQNKFRQLCQSIIAHKLFDYVVLAFIFLNCITVALERPKIMQGSLERVFLTISNYIFTAIFVAEMTVKVVSMGLYLGEKAYLRSSWNILDGFLVFVSLIDIVVSMAGGAKILGVLRVLRLLRTLRPLRVISRAPGLKLVVETLITSLKPIGNIVLICCAFFIIFGILGVQLFKGKFYYCVGFDVKNITNKSDCLAANYRWVHHKYNFDNLGQALMSLFVLASKDGWVNIMYHGLDAVGIDQQPVTNNNPWMLLYFISFLLIVSFFVLNMFVGVVVENFHKCRQHQEVEEARRREEKRQRRMEKKRRKAQKLPYYASYGPARLAIHTLCTSHYLDLVITFIICINVITMSLEHYSQPQSLETALKYCNYFFTSTFVIEASLKLVAFGFRRFFKDRWNQLDLAIVLLSVMGITLEEIEINASLPINPTIIRIMRVLRIARVLKLLKMATGMRALLDTVVQALPQVGNLGLLFMLLFFIYAALGVELFGELVCNADYPCEGMSRHATFENFGMAFLTLFQVSTGDNWNGIMKDTLRECPPDHGSDYGCHAGLQFISPMYFVSFVLTAQFVLINVVVAVLMKHLDDSNKEAQEDAEMDAEIELELAQGGLCCMMGGIGAIAGATGGGGAAHEGRAHHRCRLYSPAQESQWLDSVSLLIKDSLEGDMIDNLSGSVFHHYCSPPVCKDCKGHSQEVSGISSKLGSSCIEVLHGFSLSVKCCMNIRSDKAVLNYNLLFSDGDGGSCSGGGGGGSSPVFHLPADFFHPAAAAHPGSPGSGVSPGDRGPSRLASPASWASLRSPGANSRPLSSDSSLATGSSEGSLQTTLEEGLSFSVSPPRDLDLPMPLLCPLPNEDHPLLKRRSTTFNLQATRGHQRSQSSCGGGSTSPGCPRQDSMDPSDEDTGTGAAGDGCRQSLNSEHLSETLNSLSLTSLLTPGSLAPPPVKKCNSTGSLDQTNLSARSRDGRHFHGIDAHGNLSTPWTEGRARGEEEDSDITDTSSRKNR